jgi:hypothetical protein
MEFLTYFLAPALSYGFTFVRSSFGTEIVGLGLR